MQLDVISWFLLSLFIGVFADKRLVKQDSLVCLFQNVTADNAVKDVNLYVNGAVNHSRIVTFTFVNGHISMAWDPHMADNYRKIFMDPKRNICIANIDETYERKFEIVSSKILGEVELTILKTNYSTTVRTALNENTHEDDVLSYIRTVEQGSLVCLFENVTADNVENSVYLYVSGLENDTRIVTFKFVNGWISVDWNADKADNYEKIFMDAKRNIWIADIDETYERKFYIYSSKLLGEVEFTILKTNYSTTVRTALNETTQEGDALPDYAGYAIALIVLMVIVILMLIIIMVKKHIITWIQYKKRNSVLKPVQITSPCDSANSTSYQLVWNRPDDEYRPQKYIIRYREILLLAQSWPLGPFLSVDDIPASTVNYTLSPLKPGRCYQVEIQAINTQGQSCSNYFNIRTKESIPQPVQVTSHRDSLDSTSYQLMWDKPDDGGSQLNEYIIRYCEVEIIPDRTEYKLSKYLKPFVSVDHILPSTVSYKLSPLTPDRHYLVEIQAINTQGQSLKSFICKTKEDAPKQAIKEEKTISKVRRTSIETNSRFPILSQTVLMLQPRNKDTSRNDTQSSTSNVEQNTNIKSKKTSEETLEGHDSDSDDEQNALLRDSADQNENKDDFHLIEQGRKPIHIRKSAGK